MKKLVISLIGIYASFALTACPDGGGGGTNMIPTCPATHVFDSSQNACVPINGSGIVTPQSGPMRFADYNRRYMTNGWGVRTQTGDMQIVNAGAYKAFLKESMAICDRTIVGWDLGLTKCDSWVSGSFEIVMQIDQNLRPFLSFTAYPAPNFYQYYLSLGVQGGGVAFNPLNLSSDTTFSLINNSKGFEIRAYGSYMNGGGLRLIQIQVHQGTLADGYLNYELWYPYNGHATKIATGKLKRY